MCEAVRQRLKCLKLDDVMIVDSDNSDCECDRCVYDVDCTFCGMDLTEDEVFLWVEETDEIYCFACFANRNAS